jgi:hypothetical protein
MNPEEMEGKTFDINGSESGDNSLIIKSEMRSEIDV